MKVTTLFIMSVLGGVLILSPISGEAQNSPQGYAFFCRGPFDIHLRRYRSSGGDLKEALFVPISKSRSAAGTGGRQLSPGECAWEDRPLRSSEPRQLMFWFMTSCMQGHDLCHPYGEIDSQLRAKMAIECSMNSKCVIRVKAFNDNGRQLQALLYDTKLFNR